MKTNRLKSKLSKRVSPLLENRLRQGKGTGKAYAMYGPISSTTETSRKLDIRTEDKSSTAFKFTTKRTGESLVDLSEPITTGKSDTLGSNTVRYSGEEITTDKSYNYSTYFHDSEVVSKLEILPSTNVTKTNHHVVMSTKDGKLKTRTHGNNKNVVTEKATGNTYNVLVNHKGHSVASGSTKTDVERESITNQERSCDYTDHRTVDGGSHRTGFSEIKNDAKITTKLEADEHFSHSVGQKVVGSVKDKVVVATFNSARDEWDASGSRTLIQQEGSTTKHAVDMSPDSSNPTKIGFTPGGGSQFHDDPADAKASYYYNYTLDDARYNTTVDESDKLTTYFTPAGASQSKREAHNQFDFDILGWSVSVDGVNKLDQSTFTMGFESKGNGMRRNGFTRALDGTTTQTNKTQVQYNLGKRGEDFYKEQSNANANPQFSLELDLSQNVTLNRDITLINGSQLEGNYDRAFTANGSASFESEGEWHGADGDSAEYTVASGDGFSFYELGNYPDLSIPMYDAENEDIYSVGASTNYARDFTYFDPDGVATPGSTKYEDEAERYYFLNVFSHAGGSFESQGGMFEDAPAQYNIGAALLFMPHGEEVGQRTDFLERATPGPGPGPFGGSNFYGDLAQGGALRAAQRNQSVADEGLSETMSLLGGAGRMHVSLGDRLQAFDQLVERENYHTNQRNIMAHGDFIELIFDHSFTFEADASAMQMAMLSALPGSDLGMSLVNVGTLSALHSAQTPTTSPGRAIIVSPEAEASSPTIALAQNEAAVTRDRQAESQAHAPSFYRDTTTSAVTPDVVAEFVTDSTQRRWTTVSKEAASREGSNSEVDETSDEGVDQDEATEAQGDLSDEQVLLLYQLQHAAMQHHHAFSNDPIGFAAGDANLYRYVGNGPTNATDPSGLDEVRLPTIFGFSTFGSAYYIPEDKAGFKYERDAIEIGQVTANHKKIVTPDGDHISVEELRNYALFTHSAMKDESAIRRRVAAFAKSPWTIPTPVRAGEYPKSGIFDHTTPNPRAIFILAPFTKKDYLGIEKIPHVYMQENVTNPMDIVNYSRLHEATEIIIHGHQGGPEGIVGGATIEFDPHGPWTYISVFNPEVVQGLRDYRQTVSGLCIFNYACGGDNPTRDPNRSQLADKTGAHIFGTTEPFAVKAGLQPTGEYRMSVHSSVKERWGNGAVPMDMLHYPPSSDNRNRFPSSFLIDNWDLNKIAPIPDH